MSATFPLTANQASLPVEAVRPASSYDMAMVRLFGLWLFLQCFQYQYLSPLFQLHVGITIAPDRLVFGAILLVWLLRRASSDVEAQPMARIEYCMIFFTILGTASWLLAGSDSGEEKFRWLTTLFNLSYLPLASYFIASRLTYSRWMVQKLLKYLAFIGVYLGLTGLCEHFGLDSLVFPSYILDPMIGIQYGRVRGPFVSSTVDGGILLVCFLAITFISSRYTGFKRFATFALSLPVALSIYFSETRSIWLGLGMILMTLLFFTKQMRRPAALLLFGIFLAFVSGFGSMFSLYENTLFSKRQETIDYRLANYATTLNMVGRNPLFGVGYGQFNRQWRDYFAGILDVANLEDGNHSTLLGILAELGLVGFCLYLSVLLCAFKTCLSAYRRVEKARVFDREFVIVGLAAFEVFVIIGITSDLRFHQLLNVVVFMLLGVLSTVAPIESKSTV